MNLVRLARALYGADPAKTKPCVSAPSEQQRRHLLWHIRLAPERICAAVSDGSIWVLRIAQVWRMHPRLIEILARLAEAPHEGSAALSGGWLRPQQVVRVPLAGLL